MQTRQATATRVLCLLCRNPKVKISRVGTRESPERPVYKCPRCLLQFIQPPYSDTRAYYREEYRKEHDSALGKTLTPEERYRMMWAAHEDSANRFAKAVPQGASVLEIGCSSGYFLDHLQKRGYEVYGNEWNPEDAAYVREVGEIPCEEGDLPDVYPGKKFTAIAALQVMEHQPDPVAWLRQVKDRLVGGGYIYLELPNSWNSLMTIYGIEEFRGFWYRDPHVTYWRQQTLAKALGVMGFEAKVTTRERYGLVNHINWWLHHQPMEDYKQATAFLRMVPEGHPVAPVHNRLLAKLDKEYRTSLETLYAGDTLVAWGRSIHI